jgi:ABC-2 type transport system permease protein
MTTEAHFDAQESVRADLRATRPMYWSVRRELWENRSIYIGPLVGAVVMLLAFLITLVHLPRSMRQLADDSLAHQRSELVMPYGHATMLIALAAFVVAVLYCLDALYGERRDRSVLFWKSLPVSDLTTVLAKASIPLLFLPLIVFAVTFATHLMMLLLSTGVLLVTGGDVAMLWTRLPFIQVELVTPYALLAMALWLAPVYGWLLLISAWARRAALLWALFPPIAICVFEKIAFNTAHCFSLLGYRLIGWFTQAFAAEPPGHVDPHFIPLPELAPLQFLTTPGLWVGLVLAAIFLAAAVRMRRDRGLI